MGLLLLVLIGVAIYFIFFASKKHKTTVQKTTALDLLKEKFINGEIDEEAYKVKKDIIT